MVDRYRLTLSIGPRIIMRGWWAHLPTAEKKYTRWIGERGHNTLIDLVDEVTGEVLRSWPN